MGEKSKRLFALLSLPILFLFLFTLQRGMDRGAVRGKSEFLFLPRADLVKRFSFGFDNFLADIYWLRVIQYAAEKRYTRNGLEWMYRSVDLITELDPRFETAYQFGGIVLAFDPDFVDESIEILEKGMRNIPDRWVFPFYIGFNYFFYLRQFDRAAEYLMKASELPGAPAYLPLLATRLLAEARKPETALVFLKGMLEKTQDPTLREKIKDRIRRVQVERDLLFLEEGVKAFRERFGRYPRNLRELVEKRVIRRIPPEPFNGYYYFDEKTKEVKSSTVKERLKLYRPRGK
ncbi:MAG: hypothetical protein D6713_10135 [Deltaproteobacteria bacterium]|nr:MAG: hypothetical protein D6713_10135 [Deltaproteobacteria bacterium]